MAWYRGLPSSSPVTGLGWLAWRPVQPWGLYGMRTTAMACTPLITNTIAINIFMSGLPQLCSGVAAAGTASHCVL